MKPQHKLVAVFWKDAWYSDADHTDEQAKEHVPAIMCEVGLLTAKTADGVTIAHSEMIADGSTRQTHFIPAGMIVKVKTLRF
jgi:hypothetical protein